MRRIRLLFGVLALAAAILTGATPAPTTTAAHAATTTAPITITGMDLHDGMLAHFGSTYYLYGTEYACGFSWRTDGTPFCGFGVSTAPSLSGPWSTPTLLFDPSETVDAQAGWEHDTWTWQGLCGYGGAGCFNPRMLQRPDGVYVLWFNAPADYNIDKSNAYYAMGCNGPAGPCGTQAGAPHGSTHKPNLPICDANGDFAIAGTETGSPAIICSLPSSDGLSEEQLDSWWVNGDGTGTTNIAGLGSAEGPGAYQDPATGTWVLTYSDHQCGYCTGIATGYATAPSLLGPWTAVGGAGQVYYPPNARRDISAASCGGQPRTVSVVDGQAYQGIDLWTGAANETHANLHFEPLVYNNPTGTPGDGQLWQPFQPWSC